MNEMAPKEMFAKVVSAIDALDKAKGADDYNYYRQHMDKARELLEQLKAALHLASKGKGE